MYIIIIILLNLIILDMVLLKAVLILIRLNTHSNIAYTNYYSHKLIVLIDIMSFLVKYCRIYVVYRVYLVCILYLALFSSFVAYVSGSPICLSSPTTSFSVHDHRVCCSILRWCVPVLPDWEGLALLAAWQVSACQLCVALCCFGVGLSLLVSPSGRHKQLYTM